MTIKSSTDLISCIAHGESQDDVDYCLRTSQVSMQINLANNTEADFYAMRAMQDLTIKSAYFVPTDVVATNGTNYLRLDLGKDDGAGGAVTNIAIGMGTKNAEDGTYVVAAMAVGVARAFTGITDADTLDAGEYLVLVCTKQGTGAALRGTLFVEYEVK